MDNIITDLDAANEVRACLPGIDDQYNIEAIVFELRANNGAVPVAQIDNREFWACVASHAR